MIAKTQTYSILIQIINIVIILYNGGYAHNDLNGMNIMINDTKESSFILNNKHIKYHGIQVSAIDYGNVAHKKFKIKYDGNDKYFLTNMKDWSFSEIFNSFIPIISNIVHKIDYHKKINKLTPWERKLSFWDGVKCIFKNHKEFCDIELKKYIDMFPLGYKSIIKFYDIYNTKKNPRDVIKKSMFWFEQIIDRLVFEFDLKYPALFKQYFEFACETKWLLPKEEVLEILLINNTSEMINYIMNKI